MEMEIRSFQEQPTASAESRRIEGYALVWGVRSRVIRERGQRFVEIIEKGAITEELLQRSDVKCVFNHDPDALLARYNKGEGTLSLTLDEVGLRYSFDAPNTVDGDKVLDLVRRGDLGGSSFKFATGDKGVRYYRENGKLMRSVDEITWLADVSPVIDPAYMATSVEARAWEPEDIPEEKPEAKENQGMTESAADYYRVKLGL